MKRTKNLFALALVLMMVFSTLATPALAADEGNVIMPRTPYISCEICDGASRRISSTTDEDRPHSYRSSTCKAFGGEAHTHIPYRIVEVFRCERCGHQETYKSGYTYYTCVRDTK